MADTDLDPDVLSLVVGESPADRVIRAALMGVGCSATKNVPLYTRTIVRPSDRTPKMHSYYYEDRTLSTCQLAAMAWDRIAGCPDPEATAPYVPGDIPSDEIRLFDRYDARIEVGHGFDVSSVLAPSDSFLINTTGNDVHCVTVVSPIEASPNGTILTFETVEGGQGDVMGSTATGKFSRTLLLKNGLWYMGSRFVVRILQNRKLPIPVAALPDRGGPADETIDPAAPPLV
jgi:hypothetical protein